MNKQVFVNVAIVFSVVAVLVFLNDRYVLGFAFGHSTFEAVGSGAIICIPLGALIYAVKWKFLFQKVLRIK